MIIEGLTWLVGMAINMALFAYLYQVMNTEKPWQELVKYFFILTILAFAFFIPPIMAQATKQCEVVNSNSTITGNITKYEYTSYCYDSNTKIGITYYQAFSYIWYTIILCLMLWPIFKLVPILLKLAKVR